MDWSQSWRTLLAGCGVMLLAASGAAPAEWRRHVIDNSSQGADGARVGDVNGDGLADIASPWEEGGLVRVYINPGPFGVRQPWPAVTVGQVKSPEDAVFADMNGDGRTDVVSSCEGAEKNLYVHWAPTAPDKYLESAGWRTERLEAAAGRMQWMFTLPLEVDHRRGVDLLAGGKNASAQVGWFEAPEDPADLAAWKWRPLCDAGWIMSLRATDMDGDGDRDVLVSDRQGPASGVLWLDNPGPGPSLTRPWTSHRIGEQGGEVMFLDEGDLDGDGLPDVAVSVKPRTIMVYRRRDREARLWSAVEIPTPVSTGTAKAVAIGDMDLDGRADLVFSCEHAEGRLEGVMWMSYNGSLTAGQWTAHSIAGPAGVKFDRIELIDLDQDGDLDVITCEEREGLGVIWYENPAR